jgi:ketosteroid isomerase-like protein
MRRLWMASVMATTIATGTGCTPAPSATPTPAATPEPARDEAGVRAAAAAFYSALNVMFTGDVGPMEAVWSHADDVTYMGPMGGLTVGWTALRPIWREQAALKLGGTVQAEDMHVIIGGDVAVTTNWEKGENKGPDGKVLPVAIRATNVFRREAGAWKMVGHQTDLLPQLVK